MVYECGFWDTRQLTVEHQTFSFYICSPLDSDAAHVSLKGHKMSLEMVSVDFNWAQVCVCVWCMHTVRVRELAMCANRMHFSFRPTYWFCWCFCMHKRWLWVTCSTDTNTHLQSFHVMLSIAALNFFAWSESKLHDVHSKFTVWTLVVSSPYSIIAAWRTHTPGDLKALKQLAIWHCKVKFKDLITAWLWQNFP